MKKLSRDHLVFEMGARSAPAMVVQPGETFLIETEDCFSHQILSPEDSLDEGFDYSRVNPATGPILVDGASEGDVLEINICRITLDERGVTATFRDWGPLGDKIERSFVKIVPIEGSSAILAGCRIPLHPMIGVIGVAPKGEAVPNHTPGSHGGNLDTREITEGATVYLPVSVAGAYLAMGDLHATMGDGEVCGTGVEIRGSVEVQVNIRKGLGWTQPVVDYQDAFYFIGSAPVLDEAVKIATATAVDFISERNKIPWTEAYMLAGTGTDLRFSQVVNPWKTVKVRVPKALLRDV